jgi:hypothetical protein
MFAPVAVERGGVVGVETVFEAGVEQAGAGGAEALGDAGDGFAGGLELDGGDELSKVVGVEGELVRRMLNAE